MCPASKVVGDLDAGDVDLVLDLVALRGPTDSSCGLGLMEDRGLKIED